MLLFGIDPTDTRETSFISAITAAGITYAVTRACTMGDLVECSCDKNHILQYNAQASDNGYIDMDTRTTPFAGKRKRRRHNTNSYLRNRNIFRNVILPKGDWQWGGCGDNVMFGFRKSKDFLDARYQRLSDIRTLVKLHNNNAGRLVSDYVHFARNWRKFAVCNRMDYGNSILIAKYPILYSYFGLFVQN